VLGQWGDAISDERSRRKEVRCLCRYECKGPNDVLLVCAHTLNHRLKTHQLARIDGQCRSKLASRLRKPRKLLLKVHRNLEELDSRTIARGRVQEGAQSFKVQDHRLLAGFRSDLGKGSPLAN
jgi:hypothetical protein